MTDIYIPPTAKVLSEIPQTQIRLGIQGWPDTGKTTSALTFPNPVVTSFDNKLGFSSNRKDVLVIPFHDPKFIIEEMKISNMTEKTGRSGRNNPQFPPNRRDAFISWLRTEGSKLSINQTLIVDSWTMLQRSIDQQIELEPEYTKENKIDHFAPWANKIFYSSEICEILEGLSCNVVVTFHEHSVRDDKTGYLLDKVRPLMQGKFLAELQGHFTDWFRMHAIPKINSKGLPVELDAPNSENGKYKLSNNTEYFWQIKSDDTFDAGCGTMKGLQDNWKFLPANYNETFDRYK